MLYHGGSFLGDGFQYIAWVKCGELMTPVISHLHHIVYGWLSKLWSLLGPYYNTAPII